MAKNSSPLGEARKPPKMASQGTAGKANVSMPRKGGIPTQGGNTMGGLKTSSIKAPGSGTNSRAKSANSPSKT